MNRLGFETRDYDSLGMVGVLGTQRSGYKGTTLRLFYISAAIPNNSCLV